MRVCPADIVVPTGARTALDYLVTPMLDRMRKSMREHIVSRVRFARTCNQDPLEGRVRPLKERGGCAWVRMGKAVSPVLLLFPPRGSELSSHCSPQWVL